MSNSVNFDISLLLTFSMCKYISRKEKFKLKKNYRKSLSRTLNTSLKVSLLKLIEYFLF